MPRQRRPLDRKYAVRDARLIVIATEDTKATVTYFEGFALYYQNSKVQVKVLHRDDTNSSPERILDLLNEYSQTYQLAENDELWLVINVDRWGDKKLSYVTSQSNQKGFLLAVSNPAIELWFLLHLTSLEAYSESTKLELLANKKEVTTRTRLEQEIIKLVGSYKKDNLEVTHYLPHLKIAIQRAEQLDVQPGDSWPQQLGTHVYLLAKSIIRTVRYKR